MLQVRRLRLRQVRKFAQDHYTSGLSEPLFTTKGCVEGWGVEKERQREGRDGGKEEGRREKRGEEEGRERS